MKKQMLALISAISLMSGILPVSASAKLVSGTYEALEYFEDSQHVEIVGCETDATEIVIPEVIENKPVTKIAEKAFKDCNALTSVTIPETITYIGTNAFTSCENLENIQMPETYIEIKRGAFHGTKWYQSHRYESVTYLGNMVYSSQGNLPREITIKDGTLGIGESVFYIRQDVEKINLPDSLQVIGEDAFYYSGLTSLEIPDSVAFIGEGAFNGLKLETLTVGENNAYFASKENILYDKNFTEFVFIPSTVTQVEIPDSITEIPDNAFSYKNLTKVILPANLESIGYHAFSGTSISEITIPKTVTTIKAGAFEFCENLESVKFEEGMTFLPSDLVTIETIYDGMTENGEPYGWIEYSYEFHGGFMHSYALRKIYLPSTLETIEENVFGSCNNYHSQFDIYYNGTRADWKKVSVCKADNAIMESGGNEAILKANMHYLPDTDTILAGDVNLDGRVSVLDSIILQKYLLNQYSLSEYEFLRADVNHDGMVNIFDLCILKRNLVL